MKMIVLVLPLLFVAPFAHATASDEAETFGLWGWMASLLESENDEAANENTPAQLESVQDESRSFNSIIR
ncbi:MAG: hypothetical protein IPO95_12970 [Rhodanobacteraceae bacterium]|jgi:hypothetical protein|nr:hypothetical protein [Rhodanobacteraceae bacterium]MBL0040350.1 hypothetical protein [Xanthomonadales bacterium]MBP6078641.1 hypothetical protein [Xanthomonadales bacterium]MBP7623269.1 hypothetical protein [Xanthomonadales bacterium]